MIPQRKKAESAHTEKRPQSRTPAENPTLHLSCNGEILNEVTLEVPRFLIGRSETNDLAVSSRYISRHHILLIRHGSMTILMDLNSTNGTYVNSKRVSNHILADGDVITIDRQSRFSNHSITFIDPFATARSGSQDIADAETALIEILTEMPRLLAREDTDQQPALSENVPTLMRYVDDR